jgi:hypothetical protein
MSYSLGASAQFSVIPCDVHQLLTNAQTGQVKNGPQNDFSGNPTNQDLSTEEPSSTNAIHAVKPLSMKNRNGRRFVEKAKRLSFG